MTDKGNPTPGVCQRLRAARERAFGQRSLTTFARALGLSPSTYIYYERTRVPPGDVVARAAKIARVDLQWLLTGLGSPDLPRQGQSPELAARTGPSADASTGSADAQTSDDAAPARQPAAAAPASPWADLPPDLRLALDRLAEKAAPGALTPAAMAAMTDILRQVAQRFPAPPAAPAWRKASVDKTDGMIPILGRTAAGLVGTWAELLGEQPATTVAAIAQRALGLDVRQQAASKIVTDEQHIGYPHDKVAKLVSLVQLAAPLPSGVVEFVDAAFIRQQYPSAFAMRVDGESMTPRFRHGDVVIAIAGLPVRDGEAALVKIRGRVGVTLKLVRREETTVHLIPINEKYDTERLPETEIEWLAPVLLAARFAAGR